MPYWLQQPPRYWDLMGREVFAIVGMMRSGSNLMERSLDGLEGVMCHGELFNLQFIGFHNTHAASFAGYEKNQVRRRNENPEQFFRQVLGETKRPIVGYRLFGEHLRAGIENTIYHPLVKKIILKRNQLDSFVSLCIARQTNQWIVLHAGTQKRVEKIKVDPTEFKDFVIRNTAFYNEVYEVLSRSRQRFMVVDYAEIKNPNTVNKIAEFIGSPSKVDSVQEKIYRQNEGDTRSKVENYQELISVMQAGKFARYFT